MQVLWIGRGKLWSVNGQCINACFCNARTQCAGTELVNLLPCTQQSESAKSTFATFLTRPYSFMRIIFLKKCFFTNHCVTKSFVFQIPDASDVIFFKREKSYLCHQIKRLIFAGSVYHQRKRAARLFTLFNFGVILCIPWFIFPATGWNSGMRVAGGCCSS